MSRQTIAQRLIASYRQYDADIMVCGFLTEVDVLDRIARDGVSVDVYTYFDGSTIEISHSAMGELLVVCND